MLKDSPICSLLNIELPIVQAGMIWVSGAKLAAAAANTGCLGIIGAGSMKPELLKKHIKKAKILSPNGRLGVNFPLLYKSVEEQIGIAIDEGIDVFITSAGSPKKFTTKLKDLGKIVIHVTSSPDLAIKCELAGVDAIIAEGFEAGGHNGRDEITTMALIPQVRDAISLPLIAAGGISDSRQILAALSLGADGVQIGTGFATTIESSAHLNFKQAIIDAKFGDTRLMMKNIVPVRLLKNNFYEKVAALENRCASKDELLEVLGKGRARDGMLKGDIQSGELEIGQVSAMIDKSLSVEEYVKQLKEGIDQNLKSWPFCS